MYLIYGVLIVIGFLPFAVILYKMNRVKRMKKYGVKATGEVLDVPFGTPRALNRVLIEYTVKETGVVIKKGITVAGLPYQAGDKLPLYYDRQDPHKMLLDSGSGFTLMLVFTLLIAVFIIAACFMIQRSIETGELRSKRIFLIFRLQSPDFSLSPRSHST